jgi:capsule biosynthesis phosphatase
MKFFYNNYPRKNSLNDEIIIKQKRFCFDLDNTLVTYPTVKGDYTTVKPIEKNINFLKYLKSFGNTIIIYTARRMKTHHGNIGKINADIGKITFETLENFNIPYDEIYFGKPYADFYIDDLGVSCFDDLEKELGY